MMWVRRFKALIIFMGAIGGLLLGQWVDDVEAAGYFTRWEQLATPPAGNFTLVGAMEHIVYLQIDDGKFYGCSFADYDTPSTCTNLVAGDIPWHVIQDTNLYTLTRNIKPCDVSGPEFLFGVHREFIDCVQISIWYDDGWGRGTILVDNRNELWGWVHMEYGLVPISHLLRYPCGGMMLGLAAGLVLVRKREMRRGADKLQTCPTL